MWPLPLYPSDARPVQVAKEMHSRINAWGNVRWLGRLRQAEMDKEMDEKIHGEEGE